MRLHCFDCVMSKILLCQIGVTVLTGTEIHAYKQEIHVNVPCIYDIYVHV